MLNQNTALSKEILMLFCQRDLKLGRGEGGRDESRCRYCLPCAVFGKIYAFVIFWEKLHETSVALRAVDTTCTEQALTSVTVPPGDANTAGRCGYGTEAVS